MTATPGEPAYVLFVHPDVERDLRDIVARERWYLAYRAFRLARPQENLGPQAILEKFGHGSLLAGELGELGAVGCLP